MQQLILKANSIIWGVGKSLNLNHMTMNFEIVIIFLMLWGKWHWWKKIQMEKYTQKTNIRKMKQRALVP